MTRQEIYAAVWSQPLTAVARSLAISASTLRKACQAADIPVPARGHWVKASIGTARMPPVLPGRKEEGFVFRQRCLSLEPLTLSVLTGYVAEPKLNVATLEVPAQCDAQVRLQVPAATAEDLVPERNWLSLLEGIESALSRSPDPQLDLPRTDLKRLIRTLKICDFVWRT